MEIACEFELTTWTEKRKSLYTCKVTSADITDPGKEIVKFVGTHLAGKDDLDVNAVWFLGAKVKSFPRGLNKHFPYLHYVEINNGGLEQITKQDLCGLENLSGLFIRHNPLRLLPDDLFTEMTRLREVWFKNTKVEFVSPKLLKPFVGRPKLHISFEGNTKIDEFFQENAKGSVESLEELMKLIDIKCLKLFSCDHCHRAFKDSSNLRAHLQTHRDVKKDSSTQKGEISPTDLWVSGRLSDLNVVAGSKTFKAHKVVLAMKSSVFATTFEADPTVAEMAISVFTEAAVNAMLSFIYTGEIQQDDNAIESYAIATKFKVESMITAYERVLLDRLDNSNAFEIFKLAHLHSNDSLKAKAYSSISKLFPKPPPASMMENPEQLKELLDARSRYLDLLG